MVKAKSQPARKVKRPNSQANKRGKKGNSSDTKNVKKGNSQATKTAKKSKSPATKRGKSQSNSQSTKMAKSTKKMTKTNSQSTKVTKSTKRGRKSNSQVSEIANGVSPSAKRKEVNSQAASTKRKKYKSSATLDIVPNDVLLMIFSYLTITQRIRSVAGVCKRWNQVIQVGSLWQHVSMWEASSALQKNENLESVQIIDQELQPILKKERPALYLLRRYFNQSLRTLHLCIVTNKILQFLRDNCPRLEELCLGSSFDSSKFYPPFRIREVDFSLIPKSIVRLKIDIGGCHSAHRMPSELLGLADEPFPNLEQLVLGRYVNFSLGLLRRLSRCTKLRLLSLKSVEAITSFAVTAKSLTDLQELNLGSCIREDRTTNNILRQISENMHNLKCIKLRSAPTPPDDERSLDDGISRLRSCKQLHRIWIEHFQTFSFQGFKRLTLGLPHLKELIIVDCKRVDDQFLQLIQAKLQTLTRLGLVRCPELTDRGLDHLKYHPSIEHFEIAGKDKTSRIFPSPKIICEVAKTVDSMKNLTVLVTGSPPIQSLKPCFLELKKVRPEMDVEVYLSLTRKVDLSG